MIRIACRVTTLRGSGSRSLARALGRGPPGAPGGPRLERERRSDRTRDGARAAPSGWVSTGMPPNRLSWLRARLNRMGKRGTVRKPILLVQAVRSHRILGEVADAGAGRRSNRSLRSSCLAAITETHATVTEQCVSGVDPLKCGGSVGAQYGCPSNQLKSLVPLRGRRSLGPLSATTASRVIHWKVNASARLAEHPACRPAIPVRHLRRSSSNCCPPNFESAPFQRKSHANRTSHYTD